MMLSAPWASSERPWRTAGSQAFRGGRRESCCVWTILRGLLAMAPLVGGGESIHAIFHKEMASA